jgi:lipase chaperone LimK
LSIKNSNKKQLVILSLAVFVLLLVVNLSSKDMSASPESQLVLDTSMTQVMIIPNDKVTIKNTIVSHEKVKNIPTMVHSYAGSEPDGAVNIDENGLVIVDGDLRRLFNYFLSATGELNQKQIAQQLRLFTQANLTLQQKQQVMDLFDLYRNYLGAVDQFAASLSTNLSQIEVMNLLAEMRIELLGTDMAGAFFADEQEYFKFVNDNKNLSEDFSDQQTEWLKAENRATAYQDTVIENRMINQSTSLSVSEIEAQRIEKYGMPAAQRLQQLDQQRQQWQTTVDDYFTQRQLLGDDSESLALLNNQYASQDSKRLQALWRIRGDGF